MQLAEQQQLVEKTASSMHKATQISVENEPIMGKTNFTLGPRPKLICFVLL